MTRSAAVIVNPWAETSGIMKGIGPYSVNDRVCRVRREASIKELRAYFSFPGTQKTVRNHIERRIRKVQREGLDV